MPRTTPAASTAAPILPVRESLSGAVLGPSGSPPCANGGPWANDPAAPARSSSTAVAGPAAAGPESRPTALSPACTRPDGTGLAAIGGVRRPTGVIAPGASTSVNLVHAADQPSEVSGHHCNGCDLSPPMAQTP